jgi:antagonist of KipI
VRAEQETTLAIAGADLGALLDGAAVAMAAPIVARAGAVVRFAGRRAGARAYLAFAGGIDVAPVLGSRATHVLSQLGGLDGRPLKAGDRLPLGHVAAPPGRVARTHPPSPGLWRAAEALRAEAGRVREASRQGTLRTRLRILPGPQAHLLPPDTLDQLTRLAFTVSPQSDRMGYRLSGGRLPAPAAGTMLSDATFAGALQVPPSGEPILLMADRQTTGGYPQAAVVISADLPAAGQLAPGDEIAFELCTRAQAVSALIAQEGRLLALR